MEASAPTATAGRRRSVARRLGGWRPGWWELLLLPALVLLVVVFAIPVGTILARAFTDHTTTTGGALANLEWFFGTPAQITILLRTFLTAGIVTVACLVVGYPYAYLLTVVGSRWRLVLLGLVVVSAWQSILVRNYGWRVIMREQGVLNDVLGAVGLGEVTLLGTTAGVIVGMSQIMAPFMILPLYAGMRGIDRRLLLAARSLGAGPAVAFLRVYLPLSLRGVLAGSLLVSVFSLGFFITPALLGSTQNALLSQAMQFEIGRTLDWGHAGAQAVVLLGCTFLLLAVGAVGARLLGRRPTAGGSRS